MAAGNQLRYTETEEINMWIYEDHYYRNNNDWLKDNKPESTMRGNSIVVVADLDNGKSVLAAAIIKKLYKLIMLIAAINSDVAGSNATWEGTCSRQRVNSRPPPGKGKNHYIFAQKTCCHH
jgi:polynucleotide 5'-kinase involved in rRNA processing